MSDNAEYEELKTAVISNVRDRIDAMLPERLDDQTARAELIMASVAALPKVSGVDWCSAMLRARPALLDAAGVGSLKDRIRHAVVGSLVSELGDDVTDYVRIVRAVPSDGTAGPS